MKERSKHLQWCKERAFRFIERGQIVDAFLNFLDEMRKHEETARHNKLSELSRKFYAGELNSKDAMRKIIEEFA